MYTRASFVALFAAGSLALCGCDSPPPPPDGVEVSGKVLLPDGIPMPGGTLVLRPDGGTHGASCQVQTNGQFTLVSQAGENKVVPGKYRAYVTFAANQSGLRSAVHKRYQNTEDGDSDVLVEITAAKSDLVIRFKN